MAVGAVPKQPGPDASQRLLERHQQGDKEAFEEIFRIYEQRIYRFVLRMVRDVSDAEDITAETFIRAYDGLRKVREGSKILPWLYHVSRNLCRDLGRRKATRKTYSYDAPTGSDEGRQSAADQIPDTAPQPLGMMMDGELREQIEKAISQLPEWQRETVTLFYLEDKDISAVARALGIREGTVKSRLSRARQALKDSLEAYLEASGS